MELFKKVTHCSRCGLCQEVCPIYKITKTENTTPRGKFLQLLGVLRGDLKFSKTVRNNIKLCLNCSRCTENCPSEIDTVRLFSEIKAKKPAFLDSRMIFNLKIFFLNMTLLFKKRKIIALPDGALYFGGCIKGEVCPIAKPDKTVSQKAQKVKTPFKCCGIPFLVKGHKNVYEKLVRHNMEIIENTSCDIYFDCATCLDAVSSYPFSNPKTIERLKMFAPSAPKAPQKVTFHKPCHLKTDDIEKILAKLENVEYIPLESSSCCGFGGDFFLFHPKIAHCLSVQRAHEIYKTGAKIVYSACPTCIWSLKWGLFWVRLMSLKNPKNKNRLSWVKVANIATLSE